ncbi:Lsr2 family protein [Actinotalea sp. C106]|uniref:histone-like nucleoid-structuring protein Lsr2 n=1 Tax=Actinotalea sp. C106 TaxID=2908644 RepID=UPI0020292044|nr:Lsr2 family protein [Actinotalea sp. C106]
MAQHTQVIVTDDLDGSEQAQSYRFSWQGAEYEIDLNDTHRDEFLRALAPYIDAGRRVGGRRRAASNSAGRSASDSAAVREWAQANGYKVSDRGRIPAEIRTAYDNR